MQCLIKIAGGVIVVIAVAILLALLGRHDHDKEYAASSILDAVLTDSGSYQTQSDRFYFGDKGMLFYEARLTHVESDYIRVWLRCHLKTRVATCLVVWRVAGLQYREGVVTVNWGY